MDIPSYKNVIFAPPWCVSVPKVRQEPVFSKPHFRPFPVISSQHKYTICTNIAVYPFVFRIHKNISAKVFNHCNALYYIIITNIIKRYPFLGMGRPIPCRLTHHFLPSSHHFVNIVIIIIFIIILIKRYPFPEMARPILCRLITQGWKQILLLPFSTICTHLLIVIVFIIIFIIISLSSLFSSSVSS